ncbi:MAG: putative nickel-responsive regulator [Verrucomicrobia bacterium ADurb.Bin345]|nr:MAG: putative nickel-responsive regulator [Verrucomicrobia bacterium ADurb.Bin345]
MSKLVRLSVSLDKDLVEKFDRQISRAHCPTRSKAVGDLIRESLIRREWLEGREVAGAIILVYDHHKRDLANRLNHIQHDWHHMIMATQHFHLDHDNCLEILAVRGKPRDIAELEAGLRAVKGIKHCSLATATTGRALP